MHFRKIVPSIIFLLLQFPDTTAQEKISSIIFETPPIIDGIINEEAWINTDPISSFIQREPHNGQSFTLKTEVYIGRDEQNLYIAFRCFGDLTISQPRSWPGM